MPIKVLSYTLHELAHPKKSENVKDMTNHDEIYLTMGPHIRIHLKKNGDQLIIQSPVGNKIRIYKHAYAISIEK